MKIIFDIGGTSMRVAASHDSKSFGDPKIIPTPQLYRDGIAKLVELTQELSGSETITQLSGGIAGLLNADKTLLTQAAHLPDWVDKPLRAELEKILNVPVTIINDSAVGALGEANFGAGHGYKRVMYVSVGTGFGGAWVIDGKIVSGKFGFEPGHQIIDYIHKTGLEELVSGSSMANELGTHLQNVESEIIHGKILTPLCVGIYNTFLHWPSDIIILGGGVILNSNLQLDDVRAELYTLLNKYDPKPLIVTNKLGDKAGLFGALTL